jgi:hypothetical protein
MIVPIAASGGAALAMGSGITSVILCDRRPTATSSTLGGMPEPRRYCGGRAHASIVKRRMLTVAFSQS